MADLKKPKLDRPMRKDIAREYAKMMYADDQKRIEEQLDDYKDKLIQQSLDNIKEKVPHVCPYCNERQWFQGEQHREETINGKFFWICPCPNCHKDVYMNLFTVRFVDNGQPDYYVNSKWMKREDVFRTEEQKSRIGFGAVNR